jgi:hypothetical protein
MPPCSHCAQPFEINADEVAFLEKISPLFGGQKMLIPPPTLCPQCRSQLRCMHRNERHLSKRTCDLCKKEIVAMYPEGAPFPVYCQNCFWSDKWNAHDYGSAYDPNRPFFEQYGELLKRVPHICIINKQSQNSEYCNYAYAQKNCYLTSGSHYEEDCLYDAYSTKNRDCMDYLWLYGSERVYESLFSKSCYRSIFLDRCEECSDSLFCRECHGCEHCLFCTNLHRKKYHVLNEPHTKEEYEKKLASLKLSTFSGLSEARRMFMDVMPTKFPVRAQHLLQCERCNGDTMSNCKNMQQCFLCSDSEDCTYGCQVDGTFDSMDLDYMGYDRSEVCYQTIGGLGLFHCIACNACWNNSDLLYCQFCYSSKNLLGCASMHKADHCILNKKYSQQEYERIASTIIQSMQSDGTFGSFFPSSLSPFAYNESMAIDWFAASKEEAIARGWQWNDFDEVPQAEKVIPAERLPDNIDDIPDDILNWAIVCERSKRPFQIVHKELEFYRNMRLPIPHLHPDERHADRLKRRNPRMLWQQTCVQCGKQIQTTYDPARPEKVLCEECYLKAVY